jgi:Zn-dependent peptidase ImmA (M78 family)/transcriptional regulator with XRE-family HTH domain
VEIDDFSLAERVREAIQRTGRSHADVARSVGMDNTALSKILSGKRKISSLELAKIADATGVAVAALFADDNDVWAASISGRVDVARAPAREATELLESLLDLDELLVELGFPTDASLPPAPLPEGSEIRQGEMLAQDVRHLLGEVNSGPYSTGVGRLAQAIEVCLGMDVALHPFSDGFDGLSVRRGNFRLAVVNSGTPATRQLFTLAHEIGHLVAGDANQGFSFDAAEGGFVVDENIYGQRTPAEKRANSFASALLMPTALVKANVEGKDLDGKLVEHLLSKFGVSFDALVYRLHNIGVINSATRDQLRSQPARRSSLRSGRSGSTRARRAPRNLLIRALDAYDAGLLSPQVLADLTGTSLGEMLRQLEPPDPSDIDASGNEGGNLGVL